MAGTKNMIFIRQKLGVKVTELRMIPIRRLPKSSCKENFAVLPWAISASFSVAPNLHTMVQYGEEAVEDGARQAA